MTSARIPFIYKDFWDIPRAIVLEWNDSIYFFDCPFDDALDDYANTYKVFRLPAETATGVDVSWLDFHLRGEAIGYVESQDFEFDATRRHTVSAAVFERIRT